MGSTSEGSDPAELYQMLKRLEDRVSRIEEQLRLSPEQKENRTDFPQQNPAQLSLDTEDVLERQIGETLFARAGILVLAIGFAFLLTFPFRGLPAVLPSMFGYILVGAAWTLSHRWRESFPQLSSYVLAGALILFYFTTLRLHFFSPESAIQNTTVELVLLLLVVIVSTIAATGRRSPYLAAIGLAGGYITALVSEDALVVMCVCVALSAGAVFLARRYAWYTLLVFAACMTYLTHFTWALGNPAMGNEIHLIIGSPLNAFAVLLYVVVLACGTLFRPVGLIEGGPIVAASFVNGVAGYGLYFLLTVPLHSTSLLLYHSVASAVFLALSIVFWIRERSRVATFVYAMLGYMALSVAIISAFPSPDYFVWLACQSILVISTAIWFRSRFIIGTNFAIYCILFVAYLFRAGSVSMVSIVFGVVALLSARILNWQKGRLELKTEMMRNAYLASAFFIIPYALYHTVPAAYVTMSWVGVAVFYFVMSVLLKNNRKYRWMALLTFCVTIGYLFLVDIRNLDPAFRILSFLVLGITLFLISLLYARKRKKAQQELQEQFLSSEPHLRSEEHQERTYG